MDASTYHSLTILRFFHYQYFFTIRDYPDPCALIAFGAFERIYSALARSAVKYSIDDGDLECGRFCSVMLELNNSGYLEYIAVSKKDRENRQSQSHAVRS